MDAQQEVGSDGAAASHQGDNEDLRPCSGVAFANILLACFIAEHNLPFTTADHLVLLLKEMFPDSRIAQGMNKGSSKCTEIV